MRMKGQKSPTYENLVHTKYPGFTVVFDINSSFGRTNAMNNRLMTDEGRRCWYTDLSFWQRWIGPANWRISWDQLRHMTVPAQVWSYANAARCRASLRCGWQHCPLGELQKSWLGWRPRRKSTDFRGLNDTLRSAAQDERSSKSTWSGQQGEVLDPWHAGWNNVLSAKRAVKAAATVGMSCN